MQEMDMQESRRRVAKRDGNDQGYSMQEAARERKRQKETERDRRGGLSKR